MSPLRALLRRRAATGTASLSRLGGGVVGRTGHHGGVVWLSSRVVTCLLIGGLLGWFVDSRHALARAISRHRELSLDMIATANFDGYFTEVNPALPQEGRLVPVARVDVESGSGAPRADRRREGRHGSQAARGAPARVSEPTRSGRRERTKELNQRHTELEDARRETLQGSRSRPSTATTRRSSTPSAFVRAPRSSPPSSGSRTARSS